MFKVRVLVLDEWMSLASKEIFQIKQWVKYVSYLFRPLFSVGLMLVLTSVLIMLKVVR